MHGAIRKSRVERNEHRSIVELNRVGNAERNRRSHLGEDIALPFADGSGNHNLMQIHIGLELRAVPFALRLGSWRVRSKRRHAMQTCRDVAGTPSPELLFFAYSFMPEMSTTTTGSLPTTHAS
jgi:hypothetical protein